MRRGAWHQCGDKSQKLVEEQLQKGAGVGVVLSPRDLARPKAIEYAGKYHALGAEVLLDQQFYIPDFSNGRLDSYPLTQYRTSVSKLHQLGDAELDDLAEKLKGDCVAVGVDAVLAPAVVYEAARDDIVRLNARLFCAAKAVGDFLGRPTYATVVLGRSVVGSDATVGTVLGYATSLSAAGWYFAFEFEPERVPSSVDSVVRCCRTALTLACTGAPVLHAYAGPMALLSLGCGATGAAVGHSQNLWRFTRERWQPATGEGGGGGAPARFFSEALWGTIIQPDEIVRLSPTLRSRVLTHGVFSAALTSNPPGPWSRWDASKHLVNSICSMVARLAATSDPRKNALAAIRVLDEAVALHAAVAAEGLTLADDAAAYQANWRTALQRLLAAQSGDYDYLELLA